MSYLKSIVFDDFQNERIIYRIIKYNVQSNETFIENVIIYDNYYSRYRLNVQEGNALGELIEQELNDNYIEVTELEFNQDIEGLDARFGVRD